MSGIVGSTAYGLATENSDIDRLGVFAAPTREILSLHPPRESVVTTGPDVTYHEVGKYCALALRCNPTVMELMWLPDDLYEVRLLQGNELIGIRGAFLSQRHVRNAYFGSAVQQFRKLKSRNDNTFGPDLARRTAKHARHMYRLLRQGHELWTDGWLSIRLDNPEEVREFGNRVADGDIDFAEGVLSYFRDRFDIRKPALPEEADERTVEDWLLEVRGV